MQLSAHKPSCPISIASFFPVDNFLITDPTSTLLERHKPSSKDQVLYRLHSHLLRLAIRHSMSLNACEAYLLELKKDEIWQLLYVQRLSEGEAYERLVRKGLGWLGYAKDRRTVKPI